MLTKDVSSKSQTIRPQKFKPFDKNLAIATDGCTLGDAVLAPEPLMASRFYYGWVMLALAMLVSIASSPGQTFGVSIFIEPMRIELGLSHGQMGLAYTLGTILGAAPIFWIGHLVDRRGIRPVAILVVIAFGLSCYVMAMVQSWLHVAIAFTLLRMLGPGALSLISNNTLPFWFSRTLGTVEGYRQTAMAIAMATIPPLNLWLVYQVGWRAGYAILGTFIAGGLGMILYQWFRSEPAELGLLVDGERSCNKPASKSVANLSATPIAKVSYVPVETHGMTLRETMRTATFWIVLAGTSLFGMIQTGVFFCLTPIFQERDLNESMAATLLASFAISLACHQVVGGRLADRFNAKWLLAIGMLVFSVGLTGLSMCSTGLSIVLAGAAMGAAQGLYYSSAQPMWARYYGTKHLGKLRGMMMAINVATSSIGPFMVGNCFDFYGTFLPILQVFPFLPLIFAALSLCVRKPSFVG